MKKITFLGVFCLLPAMTFAQLDFGVKGGLNLTNISADVLTDDYHIKSTAGSEIGYHAGAFMRASLLGIYVQPELLFTSVATEYTVTDVNSTVEQLASQRIGRVDVPVLVGVRLGTIRIGIGPVASVIVSEKTDLTDLTGYETSLKSATIGYQLGGGVDLWKFGLDLRYEGNLSKLGDHIVVGGKQVNFDSRAKQLIFSLSFRF
jgi:hypothetical protein